MLRGEEYGCVLCVIVTYNSEKYILGCIESALTSGLRRVVVWDNASTDGTPGILGGVTDPRVVVLRSDENLGFAKAVNRAVRSVDLGDSDILLLNPDCLLSKDTFDGLVGSLDRDPRVGVVAPSMMLPGGHRGISGGGRPSLLKEATARLGFERRLPAWLRRILARALVWSRLSGLGDYLRTQTMAEPLELFWVSGFCMLIRNAAWVEVGGMDERFFLYFEDVAFCSRAREGGWKILANLALSAAHDESASSTPSSKSEHYYAAMWTYFALHGTRLQALIARHARGVVFD